MEITPWGAAAQFAGKILDKFVADPQAKESAKLEMYKAMQDGRIKEMEASLAAILSDSKSADPWTSRARPSFLYVVYVLLLTGIPMGILSAFNPDAAMAIATGFKMWLEAIPEPILTLFGVVMTGYVVGRSWEKTKGVA